MKKYKTIIIDGKKLLRQMFCFFCFCGLGILFFIGAQKNRITTEEILKKTLPMMEASEENAPEQR